MNGFVVKWRVQNETGRSKKLKLDYLRQWTVLKNESTGSRCQDNVWLKSCLAQDPTLFKRISFYITLWCIPHYFWFWTFLIQWHFITSVTIFQDHIKISTLARNFLQQRNFPTLTKIFNFSYFFQLYVNQLFGSCQLLMLPQFTMNYRIPFWKFLSGFCFQKWRWIPLKNFIYDSNLWRHRWSIIKGVANSAKNENLEKSYL